MESRGTKREAGEIEVAEPGNKLPRPAPCPRTLPSTLGPFLTTGALPNWAASPWMHSASTMEMLALCGTTAHLPPMVKAPTLTSETDTLIDTSRGTKRSKRGWTTCYAGSWRTEAS